MIGNKKIISAFLLFFSLIPLTQSCMQWNGDIGEWFGSWHLESLLINGEKDEDYKGNIMISFQGKIFDFAYMEAAEIYGSWSYAGEVLTLIAGYNEGNGASLPHLFNPFPVALHFPADVEQIEITVTEMNGKTMQWQYIDQNGDLITYNFKKYP